MKSRWYATLCLMLITSSVSAADPLSAGTLPPGQNELSVLDRNVLLLPAAMESPVFWKLRVPLNRETQLNDVRFVSRDKLLIAYGIAEPPVLIDTVKHSLLWRYDEASEVTGKAATKYDTYNYVASYRDSIVLSAYSAGKKTKLASVDSEKGTTLWSVELDEIIPTGFLPIYEAEVVVVVQHEKGRADLKAFDLVSGKMMWEASFGFAGEVTRPSLPLIFGSSLLYSYDGIERVDTKTGRTLWKAGDVIPSDQSPTMVIDDNALIVVDRKNTLYLLNPLTGATLLSVALSQASVYSSISSLNDRIYLRGATKDSAGGMGYFLTAINRKDGRELWSFVGSDPVVSNLIDENGKLYFATWSNVVAVNRQTGMTIFNVAASQVGRTYPVQLRKYPGKVVYIGELKIVGFHTDTGAKIYSHGFDPMNQQAHLDALDEYIGHLSGYLSQYGSLIWSGGKYTGQAGYFFDQARVSQERANYLSNESYKYRWSGASTADRSKAMSLQQQSRIESEFSKITMTIGMTAATIDNLIEGAAKLSEFEREKYARLMNDRRRIVTLQQAQNIGDYVFRPMHEDEYIGVSVIHLPSGRIAQKRLTRKGRGFYYSDDTFGLLNVADMENGLIFYHELRLLPEAGTQGAADGKKRHALHLIAEKLPFIQ